MIIEFNKSEVENIIKQHVLSAYLVNHKHDIEWMQVNAPLDLNVTLTIRFKDEKDEKTD